MLKGKKILVFTPAFFGYEEKIKNKMIALGAEVDMFDERSVTKSWQKAMLKVNPNIFNLRTEKYYFKILDSVKDKKYDYILFIKCDMPTEKILKKFKNTFIDSRICLYLWDSIKNIPNIKRKFKYFDIISSFDRYDCLNYDFMKFRPLFYCDEYKQENNIENKFEYDLCFIGTIHSDRYKILRNIVDFSKENKMKIYIYPFLQSRFIYYFYKLTKVEFKNTKISDFKFEKLSAETITDIIRKSRIVIDIEHPNQTGLTMRTIEMLGLNKKLITTNRDIINYNFYNNKNITVFERNNTKFEFDYNLMKQDYVSLDNKIYTFYSIDNWIIDVLGVEKDE